MDTNKHECRKDGALCSAQDARSMSRDGAHGVTRSSSTNSIRVDSRAAAISHAAEVRREARRTAAGVAALPLLVAIVGGSGAGKTWLAKKLHAALDPDAAHFSLDDFYRDCSRV